MNDKVLPYYDERYMRILRALTDNGAEYCGRLETHAYELFLHLNEIEHTRTKPRKPQTNGSVEKLNQTIQNEFYEVAFRRKLYRSLDEVQADLDEFMAYYNNERTNQGLVLPRPHSGHRPSRRVLNFTTSMCTIWRRRQPNSR